MLTSSNRLIRSIVLAAVVAAALAGASCGGDDEPSAGTEARNEQPPAQTTAADTEEIPETPPMESPHPVTTGIKKLRRAFLADDIAGICKSMSPAAKAGGTRGGRE